MGTYTLSSTECAKSHMCACKACLLTHKVRSKYAVLIFVASMEALNAVEGQEASHPSILPAFPKSVEEFFSTHHFLQTRLPTILPGEAETTADKKKQTQLRAGRPKGCTGTRTERHSIHSLTHLLAPFSISIISSVSHPTRPLLAQTLLCKQTETRGGTTDLLAFSTGILQFVNSRSPLFPSFSHSLLYLSRGSGLSFLTVCWRP